ncbi:helix-turn-helix transcriptional regulator [Marinomonas arenicola]|uniref:helix-turn-helix transcriptional regulator n=1 Tax=Marinomonas arenicola TaxID=569601 RepID=UPI00311D520A
MSSSLLMDLTNKIYDQGANNQDWGSVLKELCQLIKVQSASLTFISFKQKTFLPLGHHGPDYDFIKKYQSTLISQESSLDKIQELPIGAVKNNTEHITKKDQPSDLYADLLTFYKIGHISTLNILSNEHCLIKLDLYNTTDQQCLSKRETHYLECLHPHFKRTFEFSDQIRSLKEKHDAFLFTLSKVPLGIIIVDRNLKINYINKLATLLIEEGLGIHIENGNLKAHNTIDHRKIQSSISKVLDTKNMAASLQVKKDSDRKPLELSFRHVKFSKKSAAPLLNQVVLYLSCPELCSFSTERTLQEVYKLTSAEALLALAISKGLTLQEIANERNVSIQTVRSQLKSIFQKMSINSQSDLIRHILTSVHNLTP